MRFYQSRTCSLDCTRKRDFTQWGDDRDCNWIEVAALLDHLFEDGMMNSHIISCFSFYAPVCQDGAVSADES
jgi:hypothetical protein